jgi:mRNA interferase MazF
MTRAPRRGDVVFVRLGPSIGAEIRKVRPWVVVSPDELNAALGAVTAVPLSTGSHPYPFRVPCSWRGTRGHAIVDQVTTFDVSRIDRIAGELPGAAVARTFATLRELFAE